MPKRKGLGRGLEALLGTASVEPGAPGEGGEGRELPVDLIDRGAFQPRREIPEEGIEELAQSIRSQGVLQPVLVRPRAGGRYELVAGERRWRAAQRAGLDRIPVQVRDLTDEATAVIGLIENIQRENLNPIDEAAGLRRLVDEFGLTHQAVAEAVGRSRVTVSNLLRLLELEPEVRARVQGGELEMGHARALLGVSGPLQRQAAAEVVARGLSARETEGLVKRLRRGPGRRVPRGPDPDVRRLQERLSEHLGAAVEVRHGPKGAGRVVIRYSSLDELDGILARVGLGDGGTKE